MEVKKRKNIFIEMLEIEYGTKIKMVHVDKDVWKEYGKFVEGEELKQKER